MEERKAKNPTLLRQLKGTLASVADSLGRQADYYANTPEGQADVREAVDQAGRLVGAAGSLAWTIVSGVGRGIARRAGDCLKATEQVAQGDVKGAASTVVDMEKRHLQNMGRAAGAAAGAVVDGAMLTVYDEDEAVRSERRERMKRRLKYGAVLGGAALLGYELLDDDDDLYGARVDGVGVGDHTGAVPPYGHIWEPDGIAGDGELMPDVDVDDLPGVENGCLVEQTPANVEYIAAQGEIPDAEHHIDVERSPAVRAEFLAQHGLDEVPPGYELHHIVPLSEGGADDPDNMVLLPEGAHAAITRAHRLYYGWPGPEAWDT